MLLIIIFIVIAILIIITFVTSIHNIEIPTTGKKLRLIYNILTIIVIALYIIQWKINNNRPFPKYNLISEISLYLTLGWFYVTGILIIRRSISFFRDGDILSGIMLFLTGLLILIFALPIVAYLFIFIFGM